MASGGLLGLSPDGKHGVYHVQPRAAQGQLDLHLYATTLPAAVSDVVTTSTALPLGFTGDSAFFLYLTDLDASGVGTVMAKPIAGGADKQVATKRVGLQPLATTGALLLDNPRTMPSTPTLAVDLESGLYAISLP